MTARYRYDRRRIHTQAVSVMTRVCPECGNPLMVIEDRSATGYSLLYCDLCSWYMYY